MSNQANMELIKFVCDNCLIKEDIDDGQPSYPVCLAILARMSLMNSHITFSKNRSNSTWKTFEFDVPPDTDPRCLTERPSGNRDRLSVLVEDIVDELTAYFLDKVPIIQSCHMKLNPELTKCTIKINYHSRNE